MNLIKLKNQNQNVNDIDEDVLKYLPLINRRLLKSVYIINKIYFSVYYIIFRKKIIK